jgi:3-hydroxybutyryl-CoA dehydrogenase
MSERVAAIAVLGAGTMGRGIAYTAACAGYATRLYDPDESALAAAEKAVHDLLDKGVDRHKIERAAADSARRALSLATRVAEAVRNADLVIEAAPESIEIKLALFAQAEAAAPAETILASNTSGLSITEIAAATDRPHRVAGMHFFNPVHRMRLIELVRGLETADDTIETLAAVGHRMGKETVTVNESPGFVTSRINALIGNEAFRMLQEGVASPEDIDTALKLGLNHPMGPFEMVDLVGLDVRLSILEHLQATLGDLYRPSPLLVRYVRAGRLGRKVGRGVYEYDDEGAASSRNNARRRR